MQLVDNDTVGCKLKLNDYSLQVFSQFLKRLGSLFETSNQKGSSVWLTHKRRMSCPLCLLLSSDFFQ